jgi:hypothetical protein
VPAAPARLFHKFPRFSMILRGVLGFVRSFVAELGRNERRERGSRTCIDRCSLWNMCTTA